MHIGIPDNNESRKGEKYQLYWSPEEYYKFSFYVNHSMRIYNYFTSDHVSTSYNIIVQVNIGLNAACISGTLNQGLAPSHAIAVSLL